MSKSSEQDIDGFKNIKLVALIFHPNGTFIEAETDLCEFWMQLSPKAGYAKYVEIEDAAKAPVKMFELVEVIQEPSKPPYPLVLGTSVLWSRKAAIEADLSIQAYLSEVNQIHQFLSGLDL